MLHARCVVVTAWSPFILALNVSWTCGSLLLNNRCPHSKKILCIITDTEVEKIITGSKVIQWLKSLSVFVAVQKGHNGEHKGVQSSRETSQVCSWNQNEGRMLIDKEINSPHGMKMLWKYSIKAMKLLLSDNTVHELLTYVLNCT